MEKDDNCLENIPNGLKENKSYLYRNEENLARRKLNMRRRHYDDCGAWVTDASNSKLFVVVDQKFFEVQIKQQMYGTTYHKTDKSKRTGRKQIFTPLDPQPEASSIFRLNRYVVKP